jgi:hypothetical protein
MSHGRIVLVVFSSWRCVQEYSQLRLPKKSAPHSSSAVALPLGLFPRRRINLNTSGGLLSGVSWWGPLFYSLGAGGL